MENEQESDYVASPWPVLLTAADCDAMRRYALHKCMKCGNAVLIGVTEIPMSVILRVPKDRLEDAMKTCRIPPAIIAYDVIGSRQQVCPVCGGEIQVYPQRIITANEKRKLDAKVKKEDKKGKEDTEDKEAMP